MSVLKRKKGFVALMLLGLTTFSVYAACGDSACGYEGGEYVCYVVDGSGDIVRCTAKSACSITCMER